MVTEPPGAPSTSATVLAQILEWSAGRPEWQRDALRRLVTSGPLSDADIAQLAELCKSAHGLAAAQPFAPLEEKHLPSRDTTERVVTLTQITHHAGVNALAPEQHIDFGTGLTIVYGDNASGKSGYTRVLKRACRARGAEDILGNVLSAATPGQPSATVKFKVDETEQSLAWNDQGMRQHPLGNVSVFDSHCASVYLNEKTDVAFRPFGLDLFDKLSNACNAVHTVLEKQRAALEAPAQLPSLKEGTAAQKLVSRITSLTDADEIRRLGTLSDDERTRAKRLRDQLKDLSSGDPKKTARALTLRAERMEGLASQLVKVSEWSSDASIASLFASQAKVLTARRAADGLRASAFPPGLLPGTGSDSWRAMWGAAGRFSTEEAYRGKPFPVTDSEAECPLCQQDLDADASERLRRFQEFVESTLRQEFERADRATKGMVRALETFAVMDTMTVDAIEELRIDAPEIAASIETHLRAAERRRTKVLEALKAGEAIPDDLESIELNPAMVTSVATTFRERAEQVQKSGNPESKLALTKELDEFEARDQLGASVAAVVGEIERKKKLAAYQVCLKDTETRGVTQKSTEVTRAAVTAKLAGSFQEELRRLRFTHLEVELREAGGEKGALYHKLILKRAPGVEVPRVVSEGEARTLSIASFFAELSTSSDKGGILFDDPVSSLDHNWRENVALRLAEESKARQVIVFTHDIAFLVALVGCAEATGATFGHQCLRRERYGAGVSSPDIPWYAMKVKQRVGVLKSLHQAADKVFRTESRERYAQEAAYAYGRLREAWERALEETLLAGIVERYRRNIQSQQIAVLSDISPDDCKIIEAGMTKSSRWLPGHDKAAAENAPMPEPDELLTDILALETFVQSVNARRRK